MSHEEADPNFDTADKPFAGFKSGEPQGQADVAAALGLGSQEQTPPADPNPLESDKAKLEGKETADNMATLIQKHAEELYPTLLLRAKADPAVLDALVNSTDKTERKYAQKILERNPEFGAKSIEDYKVLKAKEAAGSDPAAQEMAALRVTTSDIVQKQKDADWRDWKRENSITGAFEASVDELHSQYPGVPAGHLVAMAKGLSGAAPSAPQKPGASTALGGSSAPSQEDPTSSPLAKRLLRDPAGTKKFAESYLGGKTSL